MTEEGAEGREEWNLRPSFCLPNKTFQVLTVWKAHEPPDSERFSARKIHQIFVSFLSLAPLLRLSQFLFHCSHIINTHVLIFV